MLTPEAIAERRKGIGASDAGKIVSGDWHSLWLQKTGKVEPEDLSDNFAVQLGIVTEELNLRFGELRTGAKISLRGDAIISKKYPFLRCTLDGFDLDNQTVWQAKHVNGFSKIDEVRARYTPQVTHEMLVMECSKAILSVIIGTSEPVRELIELDEFFANDYIEKCREFWGYVERNEPPPQGAPIAEPPPPAVMRVVDMSGNNFWSSAAQDWIKHRDGAKAFETCQRDLKSMVEPDMREAYGAGVRITRAKNGALTIKAVQG
jgi:predicted phage-related endonuclease